MSKNRLSLLIATALFGVSGAALSGATAEMSERTVDVDGDGVVDAVIRAREDVDLDLVLVRARTLTDTPVEADGLTLNERSIDIDDDGIPDAVLRVRQDVEVVTAIDAFETELHSFDATTKAEAEPGDLTMEETPQERVAEAGLATSGAAAVAATDRTSEKTAGELRTRTLDRSSVQAAAQEGQEIDTDEVIVHSDDLEDDVDLTASVDQDVDVDVDAGVHSDIDGSSAASDVDLAADVDGPDMLDGPEVIEGPTAADDTDVLVQEGEPADAFAPTAGTEGFSSGVTASQAQDHFAQLDQDGDASLDQAELGGEAELASNVGEYDINDDGEISANEFQSWFAATGQQQDMPETRMAEADTATEDGEEMDTDTVAAEDESLIDEQSDIVQEDEDPVEYDDF